MKPETLGQDEVNASYTLSTPRIDNVVVSAIAGHASGLGESSDEMTLRGRSEPGSRVIVQSGEQRLGMALVNGQGEWSFATSAQNPGMHCVSVIAVSAYGLERAASDVYEVRLDGLAATLSLATAQHAGPVHAAVTEGLAIAASPPAAQADHEAIEVSQPQAIAREEASTVEGQGTLAIDSVDLAEHDLTVLQPPSPDTEERLEPPQGAAVAPATGLFSVQDDTLEGGTEIRSGEATHDRTPTLRGTGQAGSQIVIYSNAEDIGETWVDTFGNWTFEPAELSFGEHRISVVAIDPAGYISAPSPPFLILIEPPFSASAPSIEPVNDEPPMTTWEQLEDGAWLLPSFLPAPEQHLALFPGEPTLDFSLIARPLAEPAFMADPAAPLAIDKLLTLDASALFQHADSGLALLEQATDDSLVVDVDVDGAWHGLDEVNSEGVEQASSLSTHWPLASDDPSIAPLS